MTTASGERPRRNADTVLGCGVLALLGVALLAVNGWRHRADFYVHRARDATANGDARGAEAYYTRALEVDPEHHDALRERGIVRVELEEWQGAIADLSKALEQVHKDAVAWNERAVAYLARGECCLAGENATQALALDPENAHALDTRATVRMYEAVALGYPNWTVLELALSDLDDALRLDPKLVSAYWHRSAVRAAHNDPKGAREDLERYESLDPSHKHSVDVRTWAEKLKKPQR